MTSSSRLDLTALTATLAEAAQAQDIPAWEKAKEFFFDALSNGDIETARAVPRALCQAPLPSRAARAWSAYFQTILDSDSQRWDTAERHALTALRLADNPKGLLPIAI